jgi:hypothetical protein
MSNQEKETPRISKGQEIFRGVALKIIEGLYPYKLRGPEDESNIHILKEKLESGESAVVMFNHTFLGDPAVAIRELFKYLDISTGISAPGSRKHYDPGRYPIDAAIMRLSKPFGIELVPVVQHYDRESYNRVEALGGFRELIKIASGTLNQPGQLLVIAPEGTRGKQGSNRTLIRAQNAIRHFKNYNPNIWYFPMAIIPEKEDYGFGFFGKGEVRAGRPFQARDIEQQDIPQGLKLADAIMLRIAELLPPEMRGFYSPYIKETTH